MRHLIILLLLLAPLAQAAETSKAPTIELSAEANRTAANDLARATVYAEAADTAPGDLARKVNGAIAQALATSKAFTSVKTQSGGSRTWPSYDKAGKINGWHMRSELQLESRDMAALSELLGKLQTSLAVSQIALMPAPETRKKAEDGAMLDAIAAFQARARLVAESLHKPWRLKELHINTGAGPRQNFFPMVRAAAMAADAMPVEAGDSQVTASVTGQIELAD